MSTALKKNAKVSFTHPRSGRSGTGKIVDILQGLRGAWYGVKEDETGVVTRFRASSLTPA